MNRGILSIESRRGYGLDNNRILFDKQMLDNSISSATYADVAAVQGMIRPRVVIPETGTWLVEIGTYQWNSSAGSGVSALTSLAINGVTAASDGDSFQVDNDNASSTAHTGRRLLQKSLVAGDVLTLKHRSSNGVACHFVRRWIRATKISA